MHDYDVHLGHSRSARVYAQSSKNDCKGIFYSSPPGSKAAVQLQYRARVQVSSW
jgi:hypothetical protein